MHHASHQPGPGLLAPIARLLRGFRNESGAVAIWFALLALPIAVLAFALIDVNRASVEKRQLQDALDAATLMAARSTAATDSELQAVGAAALVAQLSGTSDATLQSSMFKLVGTRVTGTATATVVPVIANLWLQGDMVVGADAEVSRASTNLEVSLVLDITGSMSGSKIADLKTAARDLVDTLVSDVQTPYYSKAALVPFSVGVNLGGYAANARGAVPSAKTITGASWSTGSSKSIKGATKANPAVITSNGHGFSNGDVVWITGVKGMTQLNDRAFTVANKTTNTFQLQGVSSSSYSKYKSSGTIRKCQVSDCSIVVTAASHGFNNGDPVYVTSVNGMTQINNRAFTVANRTVNTFSLSGVNGASYGSYSSGGSAWCLVAGCQYYQFIDDNGDVRQFQITTCATERVGMNAYTDTAPGSSPVGRMYTSNGTGCPSAQIVPLSTDKTALKAVISGLSATGATAGQIGTAWGWYMVSPNFGSLWPTASRPSAYDAPDVLKVVVIMTDGEFNTAYCNGVLSRDSMGSDSQQINCNATNGDETAQALALCAAMKAKDIVVYTVGFQLGGNRTAENFINSCATDSSHVYLPSSGAALKDAFSAIGRDILKLRLSR
ncbi:MAG: ubiquitin-activating E1 FCCH domain-containing protein [Caulobacter sp.]|nr:ubiquitin-activating E1 FCCH domain-containing protein [Caulobacter sp.]